MTFRKQLPEWKKGGERWGLCEIDEESLERIKAAILEVTCKLHKRVFATRPVARAFAGVIKPWEKLLGAMVVQITKEDEEDEEQILPLSSPLH